MSTRCMPTPRWRARPASTAPSCTGCAPTAWRARAVIEKVLDSDAARLKRLALRFTSPVWPGETVRYELWREGATRAAPARQRGCARDRGDEQRRGRDRLRRCPRPTSWNIDMKAGSSCRRLRGAGPGGGATLEGQGRGVVLRRCVAGGAGRVPAQFDRVAPALPGIDLSRFDATQAVVARVAGRSGGVDAPGQYRRRLQLGVDRRRRPGHLGPACTRST